MAIQLKLKVGDKAPDFTTKTNGGDNVSLANYRGKSVILYFYPKDNTPGCTMEACSFRDSYDAFRAKDVVILGVSTDSVDLHNRFAQKHRLPFPLLLDEEKEIVRKYGVWGEKTIMGMKFQGTHRVTFHIGPDGLIKHIWPKVKTGKHAQEVLAELR